jgi:hypothetical protein
MLRAAHLTHKGGKPPRQRIWEAIRAQREGFSRDSIANATRIHPATVHTYLTSLLASGHIRAVDGGIVLEKDVGIEAPRVTKEGAPVTMGRAREQLWRTMKMIRGDFTYRDLAVAASTEEFPVQEMDAADYLKHLKRAGYLHVTKPGNPAGLARYRFNSSKNTGPRPPMVQRLKTVYDPNLGRIVWHPEVDE